MTIEIKSGQTHIQSKAMVAWMLPLYVSTADNFAIKFNSLRVVELKCFRSLVLLELV